MKNILLLVPRMNIGGAESYVALVARSLKSLGYNVFIASAGGALAVELQKEGIKHFFLPIRLSKFISGLLLKRIVEKYNIDLIHANSEAAGIVAVKTRNKYKLDIPIVYTAHGVLPAKVKDIINQVDKIIAVSEFSRKSAIKEGFLAEKIQVIYNGVDTDKFKPNRQNKNLLRKKYNIPQEAFTMIIVSRIKNLRNKGHQHLLDVLKNYEVSKKWHLVVIGKGKGFSDLKKKIKEYQMMLNENRIPYLETQKSFLCESKCNSPANVANIMESCFRISDLPEEHIYAIALNTKNQITGIFEVGKGTVNCSLISAREILIRMLLAGAVSFILCHNHPSGDTNPSQEDIQITESIGKAGSLIGVSLLDHLIIGEKNYTSLREIQAVTFE